MEGKVSRRSGDQLCLGCGLGIHAIRKALGALHHYGILVKEGSPTQDGQMFRLQDKSHEIDWDGLEERRAQWDKANRKRTASATEASMAARQGVTSDVRGDVGRNPHNLGSDPEPTTTPSVTSDVGGTSHVGPDLTWDADNETQRDLYPICDDNDLLWGPVLAELKLQMTKATFDTWLRGSHIVHAENGTWTVRVESPYAVDWLTHRLMKVVKKTVERHAPHVQEIIFTAKESTHESSPV